MSTIYNDYKKLRKEAYRSYWEKRILSEVGYLIEYLYEEDREAKSLLEQAVLILKEEYRKNQQIDADAAQSVEEMLLPLSEKAKKLTYICIAHAHIDMNWMWGFQETVAVTLDTVRTVLKLMKEYPEVTFGQSQASVYHILEEYAPELLLQVKQRVKEGRWEVTASTWVENDKNMSGGEAMARHLLYTKKYLSNLLDIEEDYLNLDFEPDTFGHSYNLPEVLRNGGITRYYHCRGNNLGSIYRWRGASGAEVLVFCEPTWYNAEVGAEIYEGIPAFCKQYNVDRFLYVYGVGDHGGGPSRRDISRLIDMKSWPLFPSIKFGTYREYYDYLEERKEQFQVVDKELNYVFTGCYTSQSRIKMANRIGEVRLTETEILDTMAKLTVSEFQKSRNLEGAWRKVLFNQFHDILPGSGMVDTREYAMGEFQNAMAAAGASGLHAMDAICESAADEEQDPYQEDFSMGAGVGYGTDYSGGFGYAFVEKGSGSVRYYALFNTTQTQRTEPTEIILWDWQDDTENLRVTDMNGNEYPLEVVETGGNPSDSFYWGHTFVKILVWMPVSPLGYSICRIDVKDAKPVSDWSYWDFGRRDYITDEPICLENDKVQAIFDVPTMKCISFIRKSDGKQLIAPSKPSCSLALITEEASQEMSSWRVGRSMAKIDLNESRFIVPKKIKTTGLRKKLEYEIDRGDLKVTVKIHLDEGSEFLNFKLDTVWKLYGEADKQLVPQLRFLVPAGYEVAKYRYTMPYGVIERAPFAQDVPAIGIGCAVPADNGSAMYLVSDSKYGFRGDQDGLSVNLLRGSFDPDPYPEVGQHMINLAVGACEPDGKNLALLAENYVRPVVVRACADKPRVLDADRSFIKADGCVVSAVKDAEDGNGLIVRVFNPSENASAMTLALDHWGREAYPCDFLENQVGTENVLCEGIIKYTLGCHEVCTFRIIL